MNMQKYFSFFLFLFFSFSPTVKAQFGFSHEVGFIAGVVSFQSDYGSRNNLESQLKNTGIGVGLIHYMNFSYEADCDCYTPETYFNDHFKVRSELSYSKTNLEHYGEWVKPERTSLGADQLRAMKGSTELANIGMQLEYMPLSIRDFSSTIGSLGPFVSLGAQFSYYNAKVNSSLGPLGTAATTFPKYLVPSDDRPFGYSTESNAVWSVVSSLGTRYKLTVLSDLIVDLRFQYFFSNWVDGLNPNPEIYKENKSNDWVVWLNVGYIYYL